MEIYKCFFHSSMVLMICKIFFPLLPVFRKMGTLMPDVFLCLMEKCVFFILRFWNIKDASEYKWSHCEQMEAT